MNSVKIDPNHLVPYSSSSDGRVEQYRININNLQCKSNSPSFNALKNELRHLIRSKGNLEKTKFLVSNILESYYSSNSYVVDHTNIHFHAIFHQALIFYSACFIRGEKGKKPLEFLLEEYSGCKIHNEVRDLRDKMLSHLDGDHEHRTDDIKLILNNENGFLKPSSLCMTEHFTSALHKSNVEEWLRHIELTIKKVQDRLEIFTKELHTYLESKIPFP